MPSAQERAAHQLRTGVCGLKHGQMMDHSTFAAKQRLRREVLAELGADAAPLVLETHGGYGRMYERVWWRAAGGVVIDKDEQKAEHLARQRPTWTVYAADSEKALAGGLAAGRAFDVVDLDPYGGSLPVLAAFFACERRYPDVWHIVAHDGGRTKTRLGCAWHVGALRRAVVRLGNDIEAIYLDALRFSVAELAERAGFALTHWSGTYGGDKQQMTHYRARLQRAN